MVLLRVTLYRQIEKEFQVKQKSLSRKREICLLFENMPVRQSWLAPGKTQEK